MTIRKMATRDIPVVSAIDSELYKNAITETELLQEITDKNNGTKNPLTAPIVAVNDQGEVVGYTRFDRRVGTTDSLAIFRISTAPGQGRQGVATEMVMHVRSKLKEMKCNSIFAKVHQDRIPAMNLFAKCGFNCTGTEDVSQGDESFEAYDFEYSVPLDDRNPRHIASIAKACREERAGKEE